jgi:hypothetical protein
MVAGFISTLGEHLSKVKVVKESLRSVLCKYLQVAVAI